MDENGHVKAQRVRHCLPHQEIEDKHEEGDQKTDGHRDEVLAVHVPEFGKDGVDGDGNYEAQTGEDHLGHDDGEEPPEFLGCAGAVFGLVVGVVEWVCGVEEVGWFGGVEERFGGVGERGSCFCGKFHLLSGSGIC